MLAILLIIPTLSIITIWLFCHKAREVVFTALAFSILNLIHSLFIMHLFDPTTAAFQFQAWGLIGIDGISLWLIWLVNMLMPIVLLSSWRSINIMIKPFIILLLVINFWSNAVFMVLDLLLFYISFEGVLIPMFFLIGFYGGRNRKIQAAYQFFLYTLAGSLLLFLALIVLYLETGTTDYQILLSTPISLDRQYFLWLAFFISLAIKIPMIPVHIWLPEAHVEAPTAASVILAAILLKLGSYGFIRYSIPLFPEASAYFTPLVCTMCILGIIYSCAAALVVTDMKKIIAYSSIGHMNTATIALFTNDWAGMAAGVYFLISHGLISSALFLMVGILYDRYHTRTIKYYRGLVMIMPGFSVLFLLFTFANIAVPGTSGFISEFLTFLGAMQLHPIVALGSTTAIVLAPAYALWLYHKISYGSFTNYIPRIYQDITTKEVQLLLPLLILTMWLGINPNILFNDISLPILGILANLPVMGIRSFSTKLNINWTFISKVLLWVLSFLLLCFIYFLFINIVYCSGDMPQSSTFEVIQSSNSSNISAFLHGTTGSNDSGVTIVHSIDLSRGVVTDVSGGFMDNVNNQINQISEVVQDSVHAVQDMARDTANQVETSSSAGRTVSAVVGSVVAANAAANLAATVFAVPAGLGLAAVSAGAGLTVLAIGLNGENIIENVAQTFGTADPTSPASDSNPWLGDLPSTGNTNPSGSTTNPANTNSSVSSFVQGEMSISAFFSLFVSLYYMLFVVITGHFTTLGLYYLINRFIIGRINPNHILYSFIIKLHTRILGICTNLWLLRFYLALSWVIMLVSIYYLPYILTYIQYIEKLLA